MSTYYTAKYFTGKYFEPQYYTRGVTAPVVAGEGLITSLPFGYSPFGSVEDMLSWPSTPFWPQYAVEIDWNDDGLFDGLYDNISLDLDSLEFMVGRDYASQLIGRSRAGKFYAHMVNDEGKYSSFNAASPLYGLLLPKRKLRVRSLTVDQIVWTGFTAGPPKPIGQVGTYPQASLEAIGPLALLANNNLKISPPPMKHVKTGAVINAILDAANWPSDQRIIDDGDVEIGHWFIENKGVLEALQEIEEVENGFLCEGTNWDIVFQSRYHRNFTLSSNTSLATFSDAFNSDLPYDVVEQDDPLRQIFNRVEVTVNNYTLGSYRTLWELTDTVIIQPGESVTVIAVYKNIAYVERQYLTPQISFGSFAYFSYINVLSQVYYAKRSEFVIKNTHPTLDMKLSVVISGQPWLETTDVTVRKEDLASQMKYDLRTFPFPSPWYYNRANAESQALWALATYKDPHPVMQVGFPPLPTDMWLQSIQRKLSDRITLVATSPQTQLGISRDFWIEAYSLKLQSGALPRYTMNLSEAPPLTYYFRVDVDVLDSVTAVLAY